MERIVKIVGVVATVGGLVFALAQFSITQSVEAARPFLERKLAWCEEASEKAARIAVAGDTPDPADVARFWQMYWGVMGMVEGKEITRAMIAYGDSLRANGKGDPGKSLQIAHACRTELARDWSPIWQR